jgi:hypothetical protein
MSATYCPTKIVYDVNLLGSGSILFGSAQLDRPAKLMPITLPSLLKSGPPEPPEVVCDVLSLPFDPHELLSRVRSQLRNKREFGGSWIQFRHSC